MKCHVFVDFDGTIACEDTTDRILERFADPGWHAIENQWKAGEIGSRECMVRQIDLIRATPAEIDAALAQVEIDPHFPDFVARCQALGLPVTVVSDGLDRNVETILKRAGLNLPYFANHLEWLGDDRWRLTFPHASSDCSVLSGNCKCRVTEAVRDRLRVMIGDGRSDFCVAGRADMVLSKASLTRHCTENSLPHQPFENFAEAAELLCTWVSSRHDHTPGSPAHPGEE